MKKLIFTLIALLSVLSSNAQTVSSSSVQLKNDKSQTIAVKFDNNKTIFGLQFDVVLPDGVSLVAYNNNENFVDNFNTSVGGGFTTVYSNQIADKTYRFLLYCSNIQGNVYDGNLFNIKVKMSSDATEGGLATIKNVFYTTTEPFYDEEYDETYDIVNDNI